MRPTRFLEASSGWVALLVAAAPYPLAVRLVVVVGFLAFVPGWVVVRALRPADRLEHVVFAVAASIALATVLALAMAMTHFWHPLGALAALATLTTAVGLAPLRRRGRVDGVAT